jgi:hypothetical protein
MQQQKKRRLFNHFKKPFLLLFCFLFGKLWESLEILFSLKDNTNKVLRKQS